MSIIITKAGLCDTVQDGGRYGFRHLGLGPSGPMDAFSAAVANSLVGNHQLAAVLEMSFPAAVLRFEKPALIALSGANLNALVNGKELSLNRPHLLKSGDVVRFGERQAGVWCYLAVKGGFQGGTLLGSQSTHLAAALGKRLAKGDRLQFDTRNLDLDNTKLTWQASLPPESPRIRCLRGPEWHLLSGEDQLALSSQSFIITKDCNRMGYRLEGPPISGGDAALLSSAVESGTVQLLPGGQCIVLMAEHQTTGGYARIASVISADIGRLAQLPAGETFCFEFIDVAGAEALLLQQQHYLAQLAQSCKLKLQSLNDDLGD